MLVHRSKVGPHAACLVPPVASALEAWMQHARPLRARSDETALLVGRRGQRLSHRTVNDLLERAAAVASLGRRVEPSRLRAAIAAHLRAAGAPTRAVRGFLGDTSGLALGAAAGAMSEEVRSAILAAHPLVRTDAVGTAAP
jgi:integrase/recombinase XerC